MFERGTRLKSAPGGEALVDGVDVDVDFFSWFVRLSFALRLCRQSMRDEGARGRGSTGHFKAIKRVHNRPPRTPYTHTRSEWFMHCRKGPTSSTVSAVVDGTTYYHCFWFPAFAQLG